MLKFLLNWLRTLRRPLKVHRQSCARRFIKEFVIDEKIKKTFDRRIVPNISGWAMANTELFYIDSTKCI